MYTCLFYIIIGLLLHLTHKSLYKNAVTLAVLCLKRGTKSNSNSLPVMGA